MNKNKLNSFFKKFGFEIHGISFMQALTSAAINKNELDFLKEIYGIDELLIYDVGANRGVMIEKYLSFFPNSSIHAFEPYDDYAQKLKIQYENNKKVIINNYAISDIEDSKIFNINKSVDTSSFLTSKKTGLNSDAAVKTVNQILVSQATIDNYATSNNHNKIHILKLDIQGSELNALKGAEGMLKENKIDFIFSETYFVQQYENQPSFFDISNYLLSFGYVMQDLYYPIYGKGKIAWCDTLFVRGDLKLI